MTETGPVTESRTTREQIAELDALQIQAFDACEPCNDSGYETACRGGTGKWLHRSVDDGCRVECHVPYIQDRMEQLKGAIDAAVTTKRPNDNELSTRDERKRAAETQANLERVNSDAQSIYYEEQRARQSRIETLTLKIILEEELIPKTRWTVEDNRDRERLFIQHESTSGSPTWRPIMEMWPDASWYHVGLTIQGDEMDPEVVLRMDDEAMSMIFTPPAMLPAFMKTYGLQVDTSALVEKAEQLRTSLVALKEIVDLMEPETNA